MILSGRAKHANLHVARCERSFLQLNGQSSLQIDKPDTGDMHKHTQTIQNMDTYWWPVPQSISQEFNDLPNGVCDVMQNDKVQRISVFGSA